MVIVKASLPRKHSRVTVNGRGSVMPAGVGRGQGVSSAAGFGSASKGTVRRQESWFTPKRKQRSRGDGCANLLA
jgi:hypothetical protein